MLPELTHLQFLVLSELLDGESSGWELRERLDAHGASKNGPAFYQMMARMEDAGYISGRYEQITVGDQKVRERRYTITSSGQKAWESTRDFYQSVMATAGRRPGIAMP